MINIFIKRHVVTLKNYLIKIKKTIYSGIDYIYIKVYSNRKEPWDSLTNKLKNHTKIKIVYFVEYSSIWKYDELYNYFERDDRFQQTVICIPHSKQLNEEVLVEMERTYEYMKTKGYNVIKGINSENRPIDVKTEFAPDIVFYSRPYRYSLNKEFDILKYKDVVTCYVNYAFRVSTFSNTASKLLLPNLVTNYFIESNLHLNDLKENSRNNAVNAVVTGHPGTDAILYDTVYGNNIWKKDNLKKIIWAPHHSINDEDVLNYSNFLKYHEIMYNLAKKYSDFVQMIFKPHPLLKEKLMNHEEWGKERTEEYFKLWSDSETTNICEGSYIDLFNSSHALIHDSGSFVAEYLFSGKPVLFLDSGKSFEQFNQFGKKALEVHYIAKSKEDIEVFIIEIILDENDPLKERRNSFYLDFLKKEISASKGIYQYITNKIEN